jgi:hypothetical protein
MSFIKILTEKDFLKNAKEGYLLRPSGNSVIFLVEGTIEMEINGKPVSFDDEHIILISKKNIYKLVRFTMFIKSLMPRKIKTSLNWKTLFFIKPWVW